MIRVRSGFGFGFGFGVKVRVRVSSGTCYLISGRISSTQAHALEWGSGSG